MQPRTPQHQAIHFLTGIASCAGCGDIMLDTGMHYACPNRCATLPVDAARLDRTVDQATAAIPPGLLAPACPGSNDAQTAKEAHHRSGEHRPRTRTQGCGNTGLPGGFPAPQGRLGLRLRSPAARRPAPS